MSTIEGIEQIADLTFATVDGQDLGLDLYLPGERSGPHPVVVHIHGGGWAQGSRSDFPERAQRLAAHGFGVASIDYRLSDAAHFPAQIDDVRAAVGWLRLNSAEYGLDADRVGAWGVSAGAQLAGLLALAPHDDAGSSVKAAILWFGTHDLTERGAALVPGPELSLPAFLEGVDWPPTPSMEAALLGVGRVTEAPELAAQASPVTYARGDGPPLLLLHGDRDGLVAIEHSRRLHDAVVDAGGSSSMLIVAGANHEDDRFGDPDVIGAMAGFLRAHL